MARDMSFVQYGASYSPTKRVKYLGTVTTYEGMPVCYNYDSLDNGTGTDTTALLPAIGRRNEVEEPNYTNYLHFAGVVTGKSVGKTTNDYIEIYEPGAVCNVYAGADCDHGTTLNTGQVLGFGVQQPTPKFLPDGIPGMGSALVLQDVDRSSTAGLVMCELMTGLPTGGVCWVNSTCISTNVVTSTTAALSQITRTNARAGVTVIATSLAATSPVIFLVPSGPFPGARRTVMVNSLGGVSANLSVTFSVAKVHYASSLIQSDVAVALSSANGSAVAAWVTAVWNGKAWTTEVIISAP